MNSINRRSGVLAHPTAFEGPHGIGDLGEGAYRFIDLLQAANQTYWQILPLTPTGYADSPYQSFSSFAGQPWLISLDTLLQWGLLTESEVHDHPLFPVDTVDYDTVIPYKRQMLRIAYNRFKKEASDTLQKAFKAFKKDNDHWLADDALFMAVFEHHGMVVWNTWDPEIAFPTPTAKKKWRNQLADDVAYHEFIQFCFYKQWFALKAYANERCIEIIGDVPIFAAFNSVDVWSNQSIFYLDDAGNPTQVAGVPPDYFSEEGQLWGNPLYDWKACKDQDYAYWFKRIEQTLKCVDLLRIDHFRGFESYWSVPFGAPNAIEGKWCKGPGKPFFTKLKKDLGNLPIIAEDLGIITPEVTKLRDDLDLPGMHVLQFGFIDIEENDHLPHNHLPRSVCYTGTHDNNTTVGWYESINDLCKDKFRRYLNTDGHTPHWDLIRACLGSVSDIAIIPVQDLLGQDSRSRMNIPGTTGGNWRYRFMMEQLNLGIIDHLKDLSDIYGRNLKEKV